MEWKVTSKIFQHTENIGEIPYQMVRVKDFQGPVVGISEKTG